MAGFILDGAVALSTLLLVAVGLVEGVGFFGFGWGGWLVVNKNGR